MSKSGSMIFGWSNPKKLQDRAKAREMIFSHALKAGISLRTPEMHHFAREVFLLSRQCGAIGLIEESAKLFNIARQASERKRAQRWDFRLYRLTANVLGWQVTAHLACFFDQARKSMKIYFKTYHINNLYSIDKHKCI